MRRFFWVGVCFVCGIVFWPQWEPELFSLQVGCIAFFIITLCLRYHWLGDVSLLSLAFVLGAFRCSIIPHQEIPEQGSLVGEIRYSSGRRGVVESEMGRMFLYFYPKSPPKGTYVAVWFDKGKTTINWPGGIDYEQRTSRMRAPFRRVKDWVVLKEVEKLDKPNSFSEMKHGELLWTFASGQRGDVDDETVQLMRDTGTAHLLAISGMHIGLVSAIAYWLTKLLLSPFLFIGWERFATKLPLIAAIVISFSYGSVVGWSPSATRAVIMVILLSLGKLWDIDFSLWDLLGIASVIILLQEPAEIHSLGFQLSFMAVIGILWITPIFKKFQNPKRHPIVNKVILSLGVTIGAMLGTLPIVGWVFQQCSFVAPITNLLVSPLLAGVAVPASLMASLVQNDWQLLFLCIGDAAIQFSVLILQTFWSEPLTIAFSMTEVFIIIVVIFALRFHIICFVFLLPLFYSHSVVPDDFEVTFLSVGQGDSAIIQWPDGRNWLVDAGPFTFELVPFLRRQGIWHFDVVVLSHPHPDHMAALFPVIKQMTVDTLLTVREPEEGEHQYQRLWTLIKEKDINIEFPESEQQEGIIIHHPLDGWSTKKNRVNEQSLVLEIQYNSHRFLFTGDIEEKAEKHLLHKIGKVNVLKVPHHGSKSSSSIEWIKELDPDVAVISCGDGNNYGHPHSRTLGAYRNTNMYRTDFDGIVTVTSSEGEIQVVTSKGSKSIEMMDKP
jgi:competence protein ComEC